VRPFSHLLAGHPRGRAECRGPRRTADRHRPRGRAPTGQRRTRRARLYSCATSPGGRFVFAGDSASSVYCFDQDGTRLWKLAAGRGSALSMQYREEHLYLVTTDGSLVCVDASESAVTAAQQGSVPVARDVKLAATLPTYAPATEVAAMTSVAAAPAETVVVEWVQEAGRPGSTWCPRATTGRGTRSSPRTLREPGARYVVDAVHSASGGFYRVRGTSDGCDGQEPHRCRCASWPGTLRRGAPGPPLDGGWWLRVSGQGDPGSRRAILAADRRGEREEATTESGRSVEDGAEQVVEVRCSGGRRLAVVKAARTGVGRSAEARRSRPA
jgi:hypothetical protein